MFYINLMYVYEHTSDIRSTHCIVCAAQSRVHIKNHAPNLPVYDMTVANKSHIAEYR